MWVWKYFLNDQGPYNKSLSSYKFFEKFHDSQKSYMQVFSAKMMVPFWVVTFHFIFVLKYLRLCILDVISMSMIFDFFIYYLLLVSKINVGALCFFIFNPSVKMRWSVFLRSVFNQHRTHIWHTFISFRRECLPTTTFNTTFSWSFLIKTFYHLTIRDKDNTSTA